MLEEKRQDIPPVAAAWTEPRPPRFSVARPVALSLLLLSVCLSCGCSSSIRFPSDIGERGQPEPQTAPAEPSWQAAAEVEDWALVAQRIDRLPPTAREVASTRYVRAVAALRLADSQTALAWSDGLAERIPRLSTEIAALRAAAQLDVGPYEAAAIYYAGQEQAVAWLQAARAWEKSGKPSLALREIERALASPGASRPLTVQARKLRAELAERTGRVQLAQGDYRWLAIEAASPGADAAYERLAHRLLTKAERFRQAQRLAEAGQVDRVTRELERLKRAPGKAPMAAEIARCLARARYRSRNDHEQAARGFERAARSRRGARVNDWFRAAKAWSRARRSDRAAALYAEIIRRNRAAPAAEQARYELARLHYSRGAWDEADRAYTRYLGRYARGESGGYVRHVDASLYERALSQLAAGRGEDALQGFSELLERRSSKYRGSLLRYLKAVALASSPSAPLQREGVEQFETLLREYPFTFAAIASKARLAELGEPIPRVPLRPAASASPSSQSLLSARYDARVGEALCRQYAALDRGFRRSSPAQSALQKGVSSQSATASNSWPWHCAYPRPFASAVSELEWRYDLPPGLIHSVVRQESAFRPHARSKAGAVGLMQLMPSTAEHIAAELAIEHQPRKLEQPHYNLELGAFYLAKLLGLFDRQVVLALASYNAGPRVVTRWLEGAQKLPLDLWVARIPYRETRGYVQDVISNWARYRYLVNGPSDIPRLE